MNKFYNLSIKNRLICIILFVSVIALFLGFIITAIRNINSFKSDMLSSTTMKAKLIGEYCVGPLTFEDRSGVEQALEKLQTDQHIMMGSIYDINGRLFASYKKPGETIILADLERDISSESISGHLQVQQTITYKGEEYGSIYLLVSTSELNEKIKNHLIVILLITVGLIVLSFFLANQLQKVISKPILRLADTTRRISEEGDYSVSVEKKGTDEIGVLYDGFNDMLKQIRIREREIRRGMDRYKALISVSNTGAWEYNYDTDFLWCSPEYFSMLGRDINQFDISGISNLKETWIDLMHPEDRKRASSHFMDYLKNGSIGMYEDYFRMKHSDGNWVWILSRGRTLHDTKEKITNITVGTQIDITERKKAEEELEKHRDHLEEMVKDRTAELEEANKELKRFNKLFVGREFRIKELKDKVKELEKELGRKK